LKKRIATLLVAMVAVFSTAAFALEEGITDEATTTAQDVARGHWVYFVGKAVPRNADSTSDTECAPLRVSVRAYVAGNRAKGTMKVNERSLDLAARKDKNGKWHGLLSVDGKKVGGFMGRYFPNRKVFLGGMRLNGHLYKLELRRVLPAQAEPIDEGTE